MPTRNRLGLLKRAVACALDQQHVDVEVIVVDDGSTDGTRGWLEQQTDPRLRTEVSTYGPGVARARNAGIAAASGEWLAFLDDDDFWAPTYLSRQTEAALEARAAVAAASAVVVSTDNTPLWTLWAPGGGDLLSAVYAENVLGGPSRVVVRADAIRKTGGFDPALAVLSDWDLWIRLLRDHRATINPEALVAVTEHPGNMQVTHVEAIANEIEIIRRKHGAGAASIARTIGSAELYRWLALQYGRAGLRTRAATTYLTIGYRYRLRRDVIRAVGVLLGERVFSMARRGRSASPEYVPDWLAEVDAPPRAH